MASGSLDNTVKFWELATARMSRTISLPSGIIVSVIFSPVGLVSLIAYKDGSIVAITPEGYYDASSAAAEDNLNVRVGNRVFPVASYRDKFFRPDLVKLSLGGSLGRTSLSGVGFRSLDSVKTAPAVELVGMPASTGESKLTVNLRITDGGSGIGLVRLFVNGTAIIQDDTAAQSGGPVTRSYAVPLLNGHNELRAVAFNADDSTQSNGATASIVANLPLGGRTLHAVVVGIQEFKNPQYNLKYAVTDAQIFAKTLEEHAAPLFQNKPDIKLLTTPAETTRDSVKQSLEGMQSAVGADDVFIFYAASHGEIADDGEYFLITSDVESASPDALKKEALSATDLKALLAKIPVSKKLVIIDTCHAQPLGDALAEALRTGGMNATTATKILSRDIGVTVLAATTTEEEALEGYKDHGLFTYIVTDGLAGRADLFKQGIVTNDDIATYVRHTVPTLAENFYKHEQHPTAETSGIAFPLTEVK